MSENKGNQNITLPDRHNKTIVSHFSVIVINTLFFAKNNFNR